MCEFGNHSDNSFFSPSYGTDQPTTTDSGRVLVGNQEIGLRVIMTTPGYIATAMCRRIGLTDKDSVIP